MRSELWPAFKGVVQAMDPASAPAQNAVFSILVELRHILASEKLSPAQKDVAMQLLQDMFGTSTRLVDVCAGVGESSLLEIPRVVIAEQAALRESKEAITGAIDSMFPDAAKHRE